MLNLDGVRRAGFAPKWGPHPVRPDLQLRPIPNTTLEKSGQRSRTYHHHESIARRVHIPPRYGNVWNSAGERWVEDGTHHIQVQTQTRRAHSPLRRTTYREDQTTPGPEDPFGDCPVARLTWHTPEWRSGSSSTDG